MKKELWHLYLDSEERKLLILCLNTLRNDLIKEGRYTDVVDELLVKAMKAKLIKLRVKYV